MIAILRDTAKLLELHGANPFQVRHYQRAATCIEETPQPLAGMSPTALQELEGITASIAKLVHELDTTGTLARWKALLIQTPSGLRELLNLRGVGPRKIRRIWKALGVDNAAALLRACKQDKIAALPGFGPKTQANILASLSFRAKHQNMVHYATALPIADELVTLLQQQFPTALVSLTGPMRRQMEIIAQIDILVGTDQRTAISQWLSQQEPLRQSPLSPTPLLVWQGNWIDPRLPIGIHFCVPKAFHQQLLLQTGSAAHLSQTVHQGKTLEEIVAPLVTLESEAEAYAQAQLPPIPPELREGTTELTWARERNAPPLLEAQDLQGIFHCHTTASDGKSTLREMALRCQELGYTYLGISDHSQSAFYAGGLSADDIQAQHQEIDELNKAYPNFRIFKGIESDILADGSLDYPDEVLATFDFVIASIHSNLQMDIDKATERTLKAIANPHTTMLGHLTSRLLLRREGFPLDHEAVIDACAAHNVIIEINASPLRLELDWRWVGYALSKNVWISINPDAHDVTQLESMHHGVCVGRKGGLTASQTFNAQPLAKVAQYLTDRKKKNTPL